MIHVAKVHRRRNEKEKRTSLIQHLGHLWHEGVVHSNECLVSRRDGYNTNVHLASNEVWRWGGGEVGMVGLQKVGVRWNSV